MLVLVRARVCAPTRVYQLRDPLADFRLRSVSLRGLQRDVQLDTKRSHDLRSDVQSVVSSLEDDYFVDEVVVAFDREDEEVRVSVNFDRRLVVAEDGADLAQLVRTLGSLVSYKRPIVAAELSV